MPNREQKLEDIRRKCVEANPEIQGGHIFEVGYQTCKYCGEKRYIEDRQAKPMILDRKSPIAQEVTITVHDMAGAPCDKHFSRPVRLADVLLALDANVYFKTDFPSADFEIFCFNRWNLHTDDLTLQSDKTINFLHEMLCQN